MEKPVSHREEIRMEKQQDVFRATRGEKLFVKIFLIVLALVWLLPAYSAIVKSLAVGGINNYKFVLTNNINDVPFIYYIKKEFLK